MEMLRQDVTEGGDESSRHLGRRALGCLKGRWTVGWRGIQARLDLGLGCRGRPKSDPCGTLSLCGSHRLAETCVYDGPWPHTSRCARSSKPQMTTRGTGINTASGWS